jgi:hypothetical protein
MKRARVGFLTLCLWGALAVSLEAATFEVAQRDPRANDDGPGSPEQPWKTLKTAAQHATTGDRVIIRDGEYRESVKITANGREDAPICFEAAAGAHVVITGADRITHWSRLEGEAAIYRVPWPYRFNTWSKTMAHPDDEYHRLIGRCEQVAVEGYLMSQVLVSNQLAPGTFYADISNQTLFVWDRGSRDLNSVFAEASTRQELLSVEGDYVEWRGVTFRWAANTAQHGAVVLSGRHDRLQDCVIECMNASGATFQAPNQVVRSCVFRDNGQLGFGANGAHELLMSECLVENNNIKGFDRGWEAGGDKLVLCRGAVLERSRFVRNRGCGIWFDIGNENCTVRQCLIADNEDSGIFDEISYGLHAEDNVIVGNGFAATRGAWGAQAGIVLSSSPESIVERNLLFGNREGFNFREQSRTTPRIGGKKEVAVWNHDENIRHNLIARNRDAQVWGWFDMPDGRHWPADDGLGKTSNESSSAAPPADIAGPYKAGDATTRSNLPRLVDLHLHFEDNVYFAAPGESWFQWGVTWNRHRSYSSLEEFQRDLNVDVRGIVFDPGFANPTGWDFRLDRRSFGRCRESYPRGNVPGVLLGPLVATP